jgi:hypothetical protein
MGIVTRGSHVVKHDADEKVQGEAEDVHDGGAAILGDVLGPHLQ